MYRWYINSQNSEIIETYWNVNYFFSFNVLTLVIEIIETYWNVNYCYYTPEKEEGAEIIETYWNVNEDDVYGDSGLYEK